jgi:AAA family ATP:ADP antiporter
VRNRSQLDRGGLIFIVASGLMVAHQVAGKAVRDGLFLSRFAPSDLPKVVVAAALAAVLLGLGFARILGRSGPLRVVPLSFAGGSLLHLAEFAMLQGAGEGVRAVVITIVYLHLVGFGAILLSGFWSIVNEFFDPREAKLRYGRIAGARTLGGIAGGLLAERGAALLSVDSLLLPYA